MSSSAQAEGADIRVRDVAVSDDELTVALMDGRTITVPLAWYPRLAAATPEQRAHWERRAPATVSTGRSWMRI